MSFGELFRRTRVIRVSCCRVRLFNGVSFVLSHPGLLIFCLLDNPDSWSQLVLDETFDPSPEDAQTYLRDFCDDLFSQDFASEIDNDFVCPMLRFDKWLADQSLSESPEEGYVEHCSSASSIPVPQGSFDACIGYWAASVDETSILSRNGIVEIMFVPFNSRVRFDSFYDVLKNEWKCFAHLQI